MYTVSSIATFVPVFTIRRKSGKNGVCIQLKDMDISVGADMIVQLRTNATLATSLYGAINEMNAAPFETETAMEMDTASITVSGGGVIWTGLVTNTRAVNITGLDHMLGDDETITLCAKCVLFPNGSINGILRWSEGW